MFLLDVLPDSVGFAAFGITFLLLLATLFFYRHSKKELGEIGEPPRQSNVKQLLRKSEMTDSLALRLEEKQREFFALQHKYNRLQQRVDDVNYLSIELEELKLEIDQLLTEKDKTASQMLSLEQENQELREENHHLRKDIAEAIADKQKLMKKISLMEDMETEWQMIVEKNNQLQTKVRRIGELESLLSLLKEEKGPGAQPYPKFTS